MAPKYLTKMNVCSDHSQAKAMYARDGYLLIRGLIPQRDILNARKAILKRLKEFKRISKCSDPTMINGTHGQFLFDRST